MDGFVCFICYGCFLYVRLWNDYGWISYCYFINCYCIFCFVKVICLRNDWFCKIKNNSKCVFIKLFFLSKKIFLGCVLFYVEKN